MDDSNNSRFSRLCIVALQDERLSNRLGLSYSV